MGRASTETNGRLRVLILHSEISPYRLPLFNALGQEFDLDVAFCTQSGASREWDESLSPESEFTGRTLDNLSLGPLLLNPSILSETDVSRYDAVVLDDDPRITGARTAVAVAAAWRNIPIIVWSGRTLRGYNTTLNRIGEQLLSPLQRLVYRLADRFVAYSSDSRRFLQEHGVSPEEIETGTQAVSEGLRDSVDRSLRARLEAEFEPAECVFIYLGYFSERKGIHDLIDAFRTVSDPSARLIVAGSGDYEDQLVKRASGDDRISFPGYLSEEEKATYLDAADVLVLPAYNDPWGLVVNEAMLFGLPVITTEAVGAREMVSDNGLIVEAGDIAALRDGIETLLHDPDLRVEMGAHSTEIVEEYDIAAAKQRFANAIRSVIER